MKMLFAPLPDVDTLRCLIRYEPDTGKLFWRHRPRFYFSTDAECARWNGRYAETPALAAETKAGYLSGAIFKRLYQAHRVCWTIYAGREPELIIDHINGIRSDNRIANLREATFEQNVGNRAPNIGSTSEFRGVAWCKRDKRWLAYCANKPIGRFIDELSAAKAFNEFASAHYGEFAKLNNVEGVSP